MKSLLTVTTVELMTDNGWKVMTIPHMDLLFRSAKNVFCTFYPSTVEMEKFLTMTYCYLIITCSFEGLWTTGVQALLYVLIFNVSYFSDSFTISLFLFVFRPMILLSFLVNAFVEVFLIDFLASFCVLSNSSILTFQLRKDNIRDT